MPPTTDAADPSTPKPATAGREALRFEDMHLMVGDRLQVECPAYLGGERLIVRMVGYVDNVGLLVTAPAHHGVRVDLREDDVLVIRAFSRQKAFAFRSSILRVCKLPFDYLHLSFPTVVHSNTIRKSTRVRTHMAVRVPAAGGAPDADASIHNISSTGVLVVADRALAARGECVRLNFVTRLHDVDTPIAVEAEIRSVVKEDEADETGLRTSFRHGMEFRSLQPADRMVITAFVYQQIIENPHCIV